jgi:hypothetical protein
VQASLHVQRFATFGRARFFPSVLAARSGLFLGQAAQTWIERASSALDRYRALVMEIEEVGNDLARKTLLDQLGNRDLPNSPEYRYASVLQDVTEATGSVVDAYTSNLRRERAETLEASNDELARKVASAKAQYGERSPSMPVSTGSLNWLVPAGIGIGSLIVTLLFFSK